MRSRADSRERGFTLLEVIVALMILALALGAMLSALTTGLGGERGVARADRALSLAQSQLALIEAMPSLSTLRQTRVVDGVFDIVIDIHEGRHDRLATGREIGLFDVGVTVRYGTARSIVLSERLVRTAS